MTSIKLHFDDLQQVPQSPTLAEDAAIQLERDFVDIVREEIGMSEGFANLFAQALVRGLRRRLGGQDIYIPAPDRSARDAAIRREFNGRNLDELMRRYGVSRRRIYQIAGEGLDKSAISPLETASAAR